MKNNKNIWKKLYIFVYCIIGLALLAVIFGEDEVREVEVIKYIEVPVEVIKVIGVPESDYIEMCELYNTQVRLVNSAMDYIDEYANYDNIYLTRQIEFDCNSLV